MKLLIASAFALAATFSSVSADCKDGGCKDDDGCKKKDKTTLCVDYNNGCKDGGCKKKGDGCKKGDDCKKGDGCEGGGCKKGE